MDQPLLERITVVRGCCSLRTLKAWVRILSWLPRYNLKWLQMDLLAGLTVGLTTVPQALAYAEVAGLPVQVNDLFSLAISIIYYFLFSFCIHHSASLVSNSLRAPFFFPVVFFFLTEKCMLPMQVKWHEYSKALVNTRVNSCFSCT